MSGLVNRRFLETDAFFVAVLEFSVILNYSTTFYRFSFVKIALSTWTEAVKNWNLPEKIPEMIPTLPVAFSSVIHKIVRKFLPSSVSEHRRSKQHKFYPWKTAFQRDWSSNMSCPVSVDRVLTFFSKFRLLRMCRFLEVWPAKFKIQLKREILIISW